MQVLHATRGLDGSGAPLEFNTGMDEAPEALDMAVRLMTPQEVSLISAAPRFAFQGRADRPQVSILLTGMHVHGVTHVSCIAAWQRQDLRLQGMCIAIMSVVGQQGHPPSAAHAANYMLHCIHACAGCA